MTIYELKRLNIANGGCYFNPSIMKSFGDTLKNFNVRRDVNPEQVIVTNKRNGQRLYFSRVTGRFLNAV